ncbi:MAG TPA: hypothetical protein VKH20_08240 [Solirubrobacterales bacterium]|nr:hypothetical protein [Solirubrobacterales bacterium]
MIRQAHTYLAGAVSGTALVAAAVVAFVLLVSFQALRDWPLAGISLGGDDSAATGPSTPGVGSVSPTKAAGAAAAAGSVTTGGSLHKANGRSSAREGNRVAIDASPTAAVGSPTAEAPRPVPTGQGGSIGTPSDSSPSGSASSNPAPAGGGEGGGGGSNPSSGSGSGSTSESGKQTTSGAVTGTVNKTVSGVDEATGGGVGSTGVTEVTEKTVENVAGPESTVGHTVDEVVKTVGGLLGGSK